MGNGNTEQSILLAHDKLADDRRLEEEQPKLERTSEKTTRWTNFELRELRSKPLMIFVLGALACTLFIFSIELITAVGEALGPDTATHDPSARQARFFFEDPQSFSITEAVQEQLNGLIGEVAGTINVRSASGSEVSLNGIQVDVRYGTSQGFEIAKLSHEKEVDSLTISTPTIRRPPNREGFSTAQIPRLKLDVDVLVAPGIKLDGLQINSKNLHIWIHPDSDLSVKGTSSITTIGGDVDMSDPSSLDTCHQSINTSSGRVTGSFTLRDSLAIQSQSGSIDVDVAIGPACDASAPARFSAHSSSGRVEVRFRTTGGIPDRQYETSIQTMDGSISASLLHGIATRITSQSGGIDAHIAPVDTDNESSLYTDTMSGRTSIAVERPRSGKPLDRFKSRHHSMSGSMNLRYPQEWEGTIEGATMSGGIDISGGNVEIVHDGRGGPARRSIKARKGGSGREDSFISFESSSGSIDLGVGN